MDPPNSSAFPKGWIWVSNNILCNYILWCLQTSNILWWNRFLDGWAENSGYCLAWVQQGFWRCLSQDPHRQMWTRSSGTVCWMSGQWSGLRTGWTADPRGLFSVAQGLVGGLSLAVPLQVLGPGLFKLFINDLDEGTDVFSASSLTTQSWANTPESCAALQNGLNRL